MASKQRYTVLSKGLWIVSLVLFIHDINSGRFDLHTNLPLLMILMITRDQYLRFRRP